jgi:hypothetical protein
MRLAVTAFLLILPGLAAAQTRGPDNDVPIRIFVEGDPPSQVVFEDSSSGTSRFSHVSTYWEGHHPSKGAWALHKVALFYSDNPVPLALRTLWTQPRLDVTIVYRRYAACNPADVTRVEQAAQAATASARIQAVIGARQLLMLTENVCPDFAKRQLANVYFDASCALAKTTDYFVVSDEAKSQLIRNVPDKAAALTRIAVCEKEMRRAAVQPLMALQDEAIRQGRFADFASINGELAAMRAEPEWADVLAEPAISTRLAQSAQIGVLLQAARRARDPERALAVNAALIQLGRDRAYAETIRATSLDVGSLTQEQVGLRAELLRRSETWGQKASPGPR